MTDLTTSTYHGIEANRAYVSHSQIKAWQKCPAEWHAEFIAGAWSRPDSEALAVGSYIDAAITEPDHFAQYCEDHSDVIMTRSKSKRAAFQSADAMIAKLRDCPVAMMRLTGGDNQAIVTGVIAGIPCRIMIDCWSRDGGWLADLKSTRDLDYTEYDPELRRRQHWIAHWSYWQQMAFYRAVIHAATREWHDAYIVAVDKGEPPRVGVYEMTGYHDADNEIRVAEIAILETLKEMAPYRNIDTPPGDDHRCGSCGYCRETHTPSVMRWLSDGNKGGIWTAQQETN